MSRDFLIESWHSKECECPIQTAGLKQHDWSNELGELFDGEARVMFDLDDDDHIISEESAKEVWETVTSHLEAMSENSETESEKDRHKAMLELAEMVQKELGWA